MTCPPVEPWRSAAKQLTSQAQGVPPIYCCTAIWTRSDLSTDEKCRPLEPIHNNMTTWPVIYTQIRFMDWGGWTWGANATVVYNHYCHYHRAVLSLLQQCAVTRGTSGTISTRPHCRAKRQYLLTCKVSRYCLSALRGGTAKSRP